MSHVTQTLESEAQMPRVNRCVEMVPGGEMKPHDREVGGVRILPGMSENT